MPASVVFQMPSSAAEIGGRRVLDLRVQRGGIGRRHGQFDAAHIGGGEGEASAAGHGCPGPAGVGGTVHAVARVAEQAAHRRPGDVAIVGIEEDRDRRHLAQHHPAVGELQGLAPGEAAVGRPPDSGLRRGQQDLAVTGMHRQGADVVARERPHDIGPGGAAIGRFQDACAVVGVLREVLFPGSGVDDIGIVRIEHDGSHGERSLAVGERRPVGAAVRRLPHAALGRADIGHVVVARVDRDGVDPARGGARARIGRPRPDRRPVRRIGGNRKGLGGGDRAPRRLPLRARLGIVAPHLEDRATPRAGRNRGVRPRALVVEPALPVPGVVVVFLVGPLLGKEQSGTAKNQGDPSRGHETLLGPF